MKDSIIVTEGEHDRLLLQALLGVHASDPKVRVIAAGSWSSVDSLARSFLVRGDENVAVVVDADTTDPSLIEERRRFLRESLGAVAPVNRSRVFVIAPEIEALLFHDRDVVERLVGHAVTDSEWLSGHFEPKKTLIKLLRSIGRTERFAQVLPDLNLDSIKNSPEIAELAGFINGVTAGTRVA